jgi:hypothetical protein
VVDFGPQIEPGVQFDINRWLGIFLRVPIMFAANPKRVEDRRNHEINKIYSDGDALPDVSPPFGIIRAVIGVQGRLFGMPVKPKQNYDDMLEEDEPLAEEPIRHTNNKGRVDEELEIEAAEEEEIVIEAAEEEEIVIENAEEEEIVIETDDEDNSEDDDTDDK